MDVFRQFDFPEFYIPDIRGVTFLFEFWQAATRRSVSFPLMEVFFSEYRNIRGKLSLLRALLDAPVEMVNFAQLPRSQRPLDGITLSPNQMSKPGVANGAWGSMIFLESLLNLSETELYINVRSIFKVLDPIFLLIYL